jgi:adenylate kinase family enzyme
MKVPKRILIWGPSGAGKSTLARHLAKALEIPLVHLDRLFWKPGWIESNDEEFRTKIETAVAADAWVMDGNYSRTLDLRLPRAQLVIWLDLPRYIYFPRALWRSIKNYGRTRDDVGPDCPDRLDPAFLFGWVWSYPQRARARQAAMMGDLPAGVGSLTLRSNREVRRLVAGLPASLIGPA